MLSHHTPQVNLLGRLVRTLVTVTDDLLKVNMTVIRSHRKGSEEVQGHGHNVGSHTNHII